MSFRRIKTKLHNLARSISSFLEYSIWLFLDPAKFKKTNSTNVKKILVVLINTEKGNVGGDFCTLGVLNNLKENNPETSFHFLSDKSTLKNFGISAKFEMIPYTGKKALGRLKNSGFDAAVFLNSGGLNTSDFLFIPNRVNKSSLSVNGLLKLRKILFSTRLVYNRLDEHMVDLRFRMFNALDIESKDKTVQFMGTKEEWKNVDSFLKKNKVGKFIVLHPGGKYVAESYKEGKTAPHLWPLDKYARVARSLSKKGYSIIITGSKQEEILADEIKKKSDTKLINACGKLTVREVGELLRRSKLLIATDTAIVHLGYQVNVPIVELMGPSLPEVVGAWPPSSPKHKIIVDDKGEGYRSMRKLPFKDNLNCLENITTEQVIDAAEELINRFSSN